MNKSRTQRETNPSGINNPVNKGLRRAAINYETEQIALIAENAGHKINRNVIKMIIKSVAGVRVAPWEVNKFKKSVDKIEIPRHPLQDQADKERAEYWRKRNEFNSKIERKLAS